MSPEEIVRSYDTSIVVRRWLGAWLDFLVLLGIFLIPDLISNRFYQATLPLWVILAIAYFPLCECWCGQTLGKAVTRTSVVDEHGNLPGLGKALIRTVFRLVEVNPFLLGGVPAGIAVTVSKKRQRLGDMVAGTFVIKTVHLDLLGEHLAFVPAERLTSKPRSPWAVAAGYLGLCSVILLPAPFALIAGIIALRDLRQRPQYAGRAGALFGIVMGALGTVILIVGIVSAAIGS